MKIEKFNITIKGITPMMMRRFTDEDQIRASTVGSSSVPIDDITAQQEAEASLYRDEDGTIGWPSPNILRMLIDAGSFFKVGRSKVTTQKSSIIPAAVSLEPLFIPVIHDQDWRVDTRPIRIPATGGRILRHRPCFEDWELSFTASLDTHLIPEKLFREIVDSAGQRIGVGEFRPYCKGPFGKFVVTEWKKEKAA